jgi:hypothetical protein
VTTRIQRQRGAALVVTMMVVVALLAAGALALYLQMADTHAAQYVAKGRGALYCSESGLAGARDYIATHQSDWPAMMDSDASNDPDGYPVEGDLDGDGVNDWHVTIRDDEDEFPTNNPNVDVNGMIFVVGTCLAYPDTPREVTEMISLSGGGTHYRNQAHQGASGTNNAN